ncbi:MAG: hypothetical protein AAGA54_20655 [Myxococcota bacterium]
MHRPLLRVSLLLVSSTLACASPEEGAADDTEAGGSSSDVDGSSTAGPTGDDDGADDDGPASDGSSTGATSQCGDGVIDDPEECEPGDPDVLCASDCRLRVQERWATTQEGRLYNAVGVDAAGNVYAAGLIQGRGNEDLLVDAYSPGGELVWSYTRDSGEYDDEVATDLAVMPSGEVAVVGIGHLHRFAFSETIELLKLDGAKGTITDVRTLPKLASHSVPERGRVAVAADGAMVVTYNESGQGSLAGLNYVFYDDAGNWLRHEVRENDRSVVTDVAAGPNGDYAMLHWYAEPPPGGVIPQVELFDSTGAALTVAPLLAEGGYALGDASGVAIAPDGTLRIPARTNVIALDDDLTNAWSVRFDEANAYRASYARVAERGAMVFAGAENMANASFIASVSESGEVEWLLPLPDPGLSAMDLSGEQAALVGHSVSGDSVQTWVRAFDVR